jgi:hypothetical protein
VHDVWAGVTFWLAAAIVALGGVIGWRATRPAAATA